MQLSPANRIRNRWPAPTCLADNVKLAAAALLAVSSGAMQASASPPARFAAGFQLVSIITPDQHRLKAAFWYPTAASPDVMAPGDTRQDAARDTPILGNHLPLVVISHGALGNLAGHADTAVALAKAGFVVAAISHQEIGPGGMLETVARVDQLHDLIAYATQAWAGHAAIDQSEIGAFGFSLGGFTVLVAAGGKPDTARIQPHCQSAPTDWSCKMAHLGHLDLASHPVPPARWKSDIPIKALVLAAPAMGYLFDGGGLDRVRAPVQLWQAGDDQVLPEPWNVQAVKHDLPNPPEFHLVAGADHPDFGAPCAQSAQTPSPPFCQDKSGFDRARFHQSFDREIVRFFSRWLLLPYH